MNLSLIVAMDEGNCIGSQGKVPWHLRADLKRFKSITMGHHLIMGRKTYESIGKPLPGRVNIVLTRQENFRAPGCVVMNSLEAALEYAKTAMESEVFIIGGAQVFAQALPLADRIYLTRVHTRVPCSVHFPPFDSSEWESAGEVYTPADEENDYPSTYQLIFRRKGLYRK